MTDRRPQEPGVVIDGETALIVNATIYAEVSIGFAAIEDLDESLPTDTFRRGTPATRGRLPRRQGVPRRA
jgi:hypothetical protein